MKHLNKSRTMLLLMVLLSSLSTYAQKMVGDGFGGRAGYSPVNLQAENYNAAMLCADKKLYLWGLAQYNLNNDINTNTPTPTVVSNVSNVRQFSLGTHCSYIKEDGTGYVFGYASTYNTSLINDAYFTTVGTTSGVAFVKTDGTVWVGNVFGAIGNTCTMNNGNSSTFCLIQVPGITNAKRVAIDVAGNGALVILLADGTVKTVGGSSGSYPTALISSTPITVPGLSNIVDIKANNSNCYALTNTGQVYAWGDSYGMGTGVASGTGQYMPTLITFPSGAAPIKALNSDGNQCLALDDNSKLYGWGYAQPGSYGQSATINQSPLLLATNVRDMMTGSGSLIVKNDNTIWVSGGTANMVFGTIYSTFTQVTPPATLCAIASYTGMPPCSAGTTAPAVTPTTATNSCPTTTVNLASLAVSSTTPSGASLIWSTHKTPTSAADTLTTAQKTAVSTAGTYYALYYDATNACYSPADSVTLTITSCVVPLTANTPAAQTASTGQAKTGNAATELAPTGGVSPYIYSNGSGDAACVAPSGATALTGLTVNADGSYSYTAPTTAGTYYYCIKVCDSATPTATCIVKTYTLTVTAAACTVTGVVPTFIKN